jgi:predicted DNA-binding protein with PD1-like motif
MKLRESKLGKTVFARLYENEDLLEAVASAAEQAKISTGFFSLIGTLKKAKLGFYRDGNYEPIEIAEPLEIVSCIGNVALKDKKPIVHAHIVVSDEEGQSFGGHTLPGCLISVTAELMLVEALGMKLERKFDEKTKLNLLSFDE